MEQLWKRLDHYAPLSAESRAAWAGMITERRVKKNDFFIREGDVPRTVAFVSKGLFSQYFITEDGNTVIKRFFPEAYFMASMSALLQKGPSRFTIKALEASSILEYNFDRFKELTVQYADIAALYIRYMELHWIIEKEPLEISLRHDNATTRYLDFREAYPGLEPRLKQHEVAAYVGVTPTQLSRIRAAL
ncbi:Crp/Fnr family transcriptional regulator [Taibaiella koreensis]|uniref:Crp/Fnr family transcriptional regulator n=1 Tax=Taibaiella koreensis TaxID=1268548 RepID=UPI000E5A0911|nr:Crp/Fnr family transcriptional regulator [Taibaiella koreensis]